MTLSGKLAVVTGGARGLGRATALRLAGDGAGVVLTYLTRAEEAAAVAAEIRALGRVAEAVRCDVESPESVRALFQRAGELGGADILVNNVGNFLIKPFGEMSWPEWTAVTRNNLDSVFLCCREALPPMREKRWGRIVNLTVALLEPRGSAPRMGAYQAAKAGVLALTRTLALEVGAEGITVNAVAPGIMDTEGAGPAVRAHPERYIPAGRLGRPEEVARVISFLCHPDSGYINGAHVPVSGGWGL